MKIKKLVVMLAILIIINIGLSALLSLKLFCIEPNTFTVKIPNETTENRIVADASWTKAICDYQRKICLDYIIECAGDRVVGITPITPPLYMGENWTDARPEEWINHNWCPVPIE